MARCALTRYRGIAVATCFALLISACESETPVVESAHRSIETIADEFLAEMLDRYPAMATSYSIEGARHDRLFDNSLAALSAWQAREDAWLAELDGLGEPTDVGSRDWVSFGILREQKLLFPCMSIENPPPHQKTNELFPEGWQGHPLQQSFVRGPR